MSDIEEKKKILKSYQHCIKREKRILEDIQRLRADKMYPSVLNDGMPRGTNQSDLSNYMAILDDYMNRLEAERLEGVKARVLIMEAIHKLEDVDEQDVLTWRYIHGKKWEEICDELHCSVAQVYRLHGKALINIEI